jgi:hypothetical protein
MVPLRRVALTNVVQPSKFKVRGKDAGFAPGNGLVKCLNQEVGIELIGGDIAICSSESLRPRKFALKIQLGAIPHSPDFSRRDNKTFVEVTSAYCCQPLKFIRPLLRKLNSCTWIMNLWTAGTCEQTGKYATRKRDRSGP